jgi:hypothetical protein
LICLTANATLGKYQFTLREVHQQLLEDGFKISLNTVACYRQALGLKVALAVKQIVLRPLHK